jgi:hypothetical protein
MALIAETGSILTSGDWAGYGFCDAREPVANFSHATASLVETAVTVAPADPSGDARWRRPITGIARCARGERPGGCRASNDIDELTRRTSSPDFIPLQHASVDNGTGQQGDRSGAALDLRFGSRVDDAPKRRLQ